MSSSLQHPEIFPRHKSYHSHPSISEPNTQQTERRAIFRRLSMKPTDARSFSAAFHALAETVINIIPPSSLSLPPLTLWESAKAERRGAEIIMCWAPSLVTRAEGLGVNRVRIGVKMCSAQDMLSIMLQKHACMLALPDRSVRSHLSVTNPLGIVRLERSPDAVKVLSHWNVRA